VRQDVPILTVGVPVGFVRFVETRRDGDSGVRAGLFDLAYHLRDDVEVPQYVRDQVQCELAWFEQNLPNPPRFNRSRSKGYYRRRTTGIAWFKDSAVECIRRMHVLASVAEHCGHAVTVLTEDRPGYVVYEDEWQVIAEPFAEARRRMNR
jgi:hypothetical protein